jgi:dihydrofolate reductase
MPKHVVSRTLRDPGWNATVLGRDAASALAALKQQPGKDLIKYGTSRLDDLLLRERLIDELHSGTCRWWSAAGSACSRTSTRRR